MRGPRPRAAGSALLRAVLLCAGRGSRLDPLTADRPKCLVRVAGRAILDHQLAALRANGIDRIAVVGGYRLEDIAQHLEPAGAAPGPPELVVNPFWAVSSSIGSVWLARHLLGGPFCLLNGDVVIDAATLGSALAAMQAGVNLVIEPVETAAEDDMRVQVGDGRVLAVGKRLPLDQARFRSLGMVLCPDADGGPYRRALARTINGGHGIARYHHDVIDQLAAERRVHAAVIEQPLWQEIDRADDIARHERRLAFAA